MDSILSYEMAGESVERLYFYCFRIRRILPDPDGSFYSRLEELIRELKKRLWIWV